MKVMVKIICTFMSAAIILSACSLPFALPSRTANRWLRYDIPSKVANLDPQFTTDPTGRMVLANTGEGLVRRSPDGTLSPGAAEQYTISPDGTVYTFHLRSNGGWAGKEFRPVTAHDFVFAFQRMFMAESPFSRDYMLIKNAGDILEGKASPTELGVKAIDDHTLTITLEHRSPLFLELLSSTAAIPCNREAFQDAKGRYGLEKRFAMANGPYYLDGWTDRQLTLRPNPNYWGEVPSPGVYIYIDREDPFGRFLSGSTDVIPLISSAEVTRAGGADASVGVFQTATWCIVFNQNDPVWGNPFMRQGLAHGVDRRVFEGRLPENLTPGDHLIPPSTLLTDKPFRLLVPQESPLGYDGIRARRLFTMGMEALGMNEFPITDMYVPDGGGHAANMGLIQGSWQRNLSAYVNIVTVPPEEIAERFSRGDYQILLMPITPENDGIEAVLGLFETSSRQNPFGYYNPRIDELIMLGLTAADLDTAAFRFSQAERTLLADAVVIPVYHGDSYYALGKDVHGVEVFPYGGRIYFGSGYRS